MIKLLQLFTVALSIFITNTVFAEDNINDKTGFYIGGEGGVVEPVVSKFRHKHSNTEIILKRASMYSGKIGYTIYPQISVEFSATYQPKYRLHYVLPPQNLSNGLTIPKTPGNTKVFSNIYMLNLIYDLEEMNGITPFVIIGGGIAQVKVKPISSKWDVINSDYFKVRKTHKNCVAWQAGLGVSKSLSSNFSVDLTAKLQTVYRVRIDYDTLDMKTGQFLPAKPIKKTIGVGEFGIGFTYRLPF
ncbi:outer membrane protein [Rickettsia endosymbiont of Pantilius tunicatus]|uniref:outer membrane protein n=1 Tax=Rickettsia endosymbiont of Pantilius tunicatus TaxID=3066267 RepID=UPI0030E0976E